MAKLKKKKAFKYRSISKGEYEDLIYKMYHAQELTQREKNILKDLV